MKDYNEFIKFLFSLGMEVSNDYTINSAITDGCIRGMKGIDYIGNCYRTGGVSGGTCWEDSNPREYSRMPPNDEVIFVEKQIDKILTVLNPGISFPIYRQLIRLIKEDDFIEYHYYGNRDDYQIKYVDVMELHGALLKTGVIIEF